LPEIQEDGQISINMQGSCLKPGKNNHGSGLGSLVKYPG